MTHLPNGSCATFLLLPHYDVICDLLLNRRTATWNLFAEWSTLKTQAPLCTFCQKEDESIKHLFFSCRVSREFWKHLLSWLRDNDINVGELKEVDLILGKFDMEDDSTLINHILLLGKYSIYFRKSQNAKPSLKGFIAKTKRVYSIEPHIARKRDKLTYFPCLYANKTQANFVAETVRLCRLRYKRDFKYPESRTMSSQAAVITILCYISAIRD